MPGPRPAHACALFCTSSDVSAALAAIWALGDGVSSGWLLDEATRASATLPGLILDPGNRNIAYAALWTGIITTAANRVAETSALGKLSSAEAAVLLATEPIWAALFAALLLGEGLGLNDVAGGALIVGACLCNAVEPSKLTALLMMREEQEEPK